MNLKQLSSKYRLDVDPYAPDLRAVNSLDNKIQINVHVQEGMNGCSIW